MNCPDCAQTLSPTTHEGIQVDECRHCGGTWFEADELRRAKDSADDDLRWLDFDAFAAAKRDPGSASTRSCPECGAPLHLVGYMYSDVVIDVCPAEHGEWLDDGEFHKILDHLEKIVLSSDKREYRRRAVEELKEIVTGPEGRISELKDFLVAVRLLQYRVGVEHPKAAQAITDLSNRL